MDDKPFFNIVYEAIMSMNSDESTKKDILEKLDKRINEEIEKDKDFLKKFDTMGRTPLMFASSYDNEGIVKLLLNKNKGDNINQQNRHGDTALIFACENKNNYDTVKLLLDNRAEINIKNKYGQTALDIACENNFKNIVELLLEKGAEINIKNTNSETPLWIACEKGHEEIVELLLEKGAEINIKNKDDDTPLWIACKKGYQKIVELLLEKGADINNINKIGYTPLWIACEKGHEKIVELLLNKDAKINNKDLSIACEKGYEKIVELLLEKGSDININIEKKNGDTLLMTACEKGYEKIVELLLEKGANINNINTDKQTALMLTKGNDKILNQLLDKGCKVDETDINGFTTLMHVLQNLEDKYDKETLERILITVEKILIKGASKTINTQTNDYKLTALMIACVKGHKDIVELLLKYGADLSLEDKKGNRAFYHARNFPEIFKFLENEERKIIDKNAEELIAELIAEEERIAAEKEKKNRQKQKKKEQAQQLKEVVEKEKKAQQLKELVEKEKKAQQQAQKLREEEERKAQQQKEKQRIAYEKEKEAELNIQKRRKSDVLKKLHYCGNKDYQTNVIHLSDLQSTIETTKQQLNNIAQTMISTINESIEKKNKIKLKESQQKFNNSIDTLKTSEKEYEKLTNENINKLNDCYKSYFYMKDIKHINQRGTIQIAIDFSKDKDIYDSIKIHGIFPDDKVAINDTPKTVELEELYKELETVDSSPFFDPSKLNQEWYYYFYMKHYINFFTHEKLCLESFNRHFNFTKQDIDIFKYNIIFLSEPIIYKLYDGLYSQLKKIFSSKKSNKQKNDEMNTILYANFSSFDKIAILKEEEETEKNEYNMKIDFKIVFNSEEGIWQFPPPISFEKDGKRSKRLKKSIKIRSKRLKKSIKIRSKRLKKSIKIRSKRLKSIKRSRKKFFNHKN